LKTRISTASSATNMRASALEYPTPGWINFQSATLGQFCIGGNTDQGLCISLYLGSWQAACQGGS
ncbi:hypothetical protein, partial [Candidatus Binatus sp.]|uniref:hypothetical protein n=1 Tax=Candidatus Binatus sp. TaxID=2811406 RepID=UPI003C4B45BF